MKTAPAPAPAPLRITFEVDHQPETISEWWVDVVGRGVSAEMCRERPTRWHANGGGLVRDREAPWSWTCSMYYDLDGINRRVDVEIPDGASVAEAKRIVRERLAGALVGWQMVPSVAERGGSIK